MILALDLSLACVGWSKFSSDGKLVDRGRIIPAKELDNCFKICYIAEQIKNLYVGIEELVVEDVFVGINVRSTIWLTRLAGAIIRDWVAFKYKSVNFINASHARAVMGINAQSHKAEIQVWVLNNYQIIPKDKIEKYEKITTKLKEQFKKEDLTKGKYKYQMSLISDKIDKDTGVGEDTADSIIVGLAYIREKNGTAQKRKRSRKVTRRK